MLAWITEKLSRTDDSLATDAGLRAFLESIPHAKPAQALDDIGAHIAGAAELQLEPAACRHVLQRMDEAAHLLQRELWASLFDDGIGTAILDTHWRALASYQRNLFSGCAWCLAQLPARDMLDATARQDALVMATRAMAALAAHNALMRIRYRDPLPAFWTEAEALYTRALEYGLAQSPLRLYPGLTQHTTVEREYVAALLLEAAPTGNLLPTQNYCLHLVLREVSEHFRFADAYAPHAPYYIDVAKAKPPQRWLVGLTPRAGMRFFGFGEANAALGVLRTAAQDEDKVPKWLEGSRIDAGGYRALLDTIAEHWSETPPQRRSRRDRQVAAIFTTHGFAQVHRMIAYSRFAREGRKLSYAESSLQDLVNYRAMQEFGSVADDKSRPAPESPATPMEVLQRFEQSCDREMIERWSVIDISEGGLGAIAERHDGWLRAGMLIGYRYHDSIDWRVAAVRRLRRTAQGKLSVGMKCLPDTAHCARLRMENTDENNVWLAVGIGDVAYADAILVDGGESMLIAARGTWAPGRECAMTVDKRTQNIRFLALLERGIDFERISFSPAARD